MKETREEYGSTECSISWHDENTVTDVSCGLPEDLVGRLNNKKDKLRLKVTNDLFLFGDEKKSVEEACHGI